VQWSVAIEAETPDGRALTREEVVELADAVAAHSGIASGIGTARYGARVVVTAASRDEALTAATAVFAAAVRTAGVPPGPVVHTEAIGEDEDGPE
jgi:hypothetical protein